MGSTAARPRAVLVVDEHAPTPEHDAGSLRMLRLLDALASLGYRVAFAALDGSRSDALAGSEAEQIVGEPVTEHLVRCGERYSVVVLSRPDVASALIGPVRRHAAGALLVYDTVDLSFVREYRLAKLNHSRRLLAQALRRRAQELALVHAADCTLVVSEPEREVVLAASPSCRVHVVSTIHAPTGAGRPFALRSGALFVGNFRHGPNHDAARTLVEDVWPRVRRHARAIPLHVVGGPPPDWLAGAAATDVHVHGWLDANTLDGLFDRCRLSVAPLRAGAGVKGKVLESLSRGVPVAGYPLAFEGLPVVAGRDVLVAATPDELAAAVIALDTDEELWQRLSSAGPPIVEAGFSFDAARAALREALGAAKAVA